MSSCLYARYFLYVYVHLQICKFASSLRIVSIAILSALRRTHTYERKLNYQAILNERL